jgi:hypothetical protein
MPGSLTHSTDPFSTKPQVGNIRVQEYDSKNNSIIVRMTMRATSKALLDSMVFTNTTDPKLPYHNQFTLIHLNTASKEDKKKLLLNNCAQVDVDILYPLGQKQKPVVTAGQLSIASSNGQMNVMMKETTQTTKSTTIFKSFHAQLANGEINVDNLAVSRLTKFEVTNGHVYGRLTTSGKVEAESMNGPIDLGIDTTPLQPEWSNKEFYVDASAISGRITVSLVKHLT